MPERTTFATSTSAAEVVVVTGAGGMGRAIVRRIAAGRTVVLADVDEASLAGVADGLRRDGHGVHPVRTDVSSSADVAELARVAGALGAVRCLVHTAGVSPVQATTEQIFAVDVLGTALLLDAFEPSVRTGTVAVCIASMAGSLFDLPADTVRLLATTPTDRLLALDVLDRALDPGAAYGIAKRANQARVEAASVSWGRRGGRVVSISPGVISTSMGASELAGPHSDVMRAMVGMSGCGRLGTADDIAAVVEFLVSPAASFISGTDVRVDGGAVAALRHFTNG
jgi:NAD(P)-dependent dehydrogenase (short-subunit alcohol dehydrogenase family)